MRTSRNWLETGTLIATLLLSLADTAFAQEGGDVGRVVFVTPKAGMVQQWEEAYRRHVDWHRGRNDSWSWPVWQIISGERSGQFAIGTFGHKWKDMDRGDFGVQNSADAQKNQGQFAESVVFEFWAYDEGLSRPPAEGTPPPALAPTTPTSTRAWRQSTEPRWRRSWPRSRRPTGATRATPTP